MAGIDAYFSSIIWTKAIPLILIITGLVYLWSKRKTIGLWYENWLQTMDCPHNFNELDECYKENLFSRLRYVKSGDFDLRNRGLVRVLEIGVGHGKNLKYLPLNCQLIVVEPNKFTRPSFTRNLKDNPLINLNKFVEGYAENITLQNESVDIVVSTGCLCACEDVGVVLAEVSRVLYHVSNLNQLYRGVFLMQMSKAGNFRKPIESKSKFLNISKYPKLKFFLQHGIFVYMEHTLHPRKRYKNIVLMLLNPVWKLIYGCNISINLPPMLQKYFNKVRFDEITNHSIILNNIIVGSATK